MVKELIREAVEDLFRNPFQRSGESWLVLLFIALIAAPTIYISGRYIERSLLKRFGKDVNALEITPVIVTIFILGLLVGGVILVVGLALAS
jgi:Mn2+/Fe2+ NRAMP family transporter